VNGFNDRLYALLPSAIRVRDLASDDQPLRSILSVISEQVDVLENDIAQLYENLFIETCQEWVVPYIGDLVGYQVLYEAGEPTSSTGREALLLDRILIPRQDVGNTVRARRRKGTLGVLPELARDVAGWPAIAVELGTLAGLTQALNDLRAARGRTVDVHQQSALDRIGGPLDALSRTFEIRATASQAASGALPTSGVGLFVPRYRSYSVSFCTAAWIRGVGDHCFTFSPLGEDLTLFGRPQAALRGAGGAILPIALSRDDVGDPLHYGVGKSLAVWIGSQGEKREPALVPIEAVVPADLTHWRHQPEPGKIAVDALRGRLSFARDEIPHRVFVAYHYGFSFEIGASEYPRTLRSIPSALLTAAVDDNAITFGGRVIAGIDVGVTIDGSATASYTTTGADTLESVAAALGMAIAALGIPGISASANKTLLTVAGAQALLVAFPPRTYSVASTRHHESHRLLAETLARWRSDGPARAIIEIEDSEVYDEEDLDIQLGGRQYLEVRAASGARPFIRMVNADVGQPDVVRVVGDATATFVLDGLMIGGGIRVAGNLGELTVRRSTLIPGWSALRHGDRHRHIEPSIAVNGSPASLRIEKSILGPISVEREESPPRPLRMAISDSIVGADHRGEALGSPDARAADVELRILRTTAFGRMRAHSIVLAENVIFDDAVTVTDRQHGCFRFCYVPPESRTPSRYECQPAEGDQVVPAFVSKRFGDAGYARLQDDGRKQILEGADDRSEMGAFHDLFLAQRKANLVTRLAEYTPAGVVTSVLPV
jgi:hypothetical protein